MLRRGREHAHSLAWAGTVRTLSLRAGTGRTSPAGDTMAFAGTGMAGEDAIIVGFGGTVRTPL